MPTEVVTVRMVAEEALEHARRMEREAIGIREDVEEFIGWLTQNPHWGDIVVRERVVEQATGDS